MSTPASDTITMFGAEWCGDCRRTKKQLEEFVLSRADQSDAASFMAMVVGWELEDEFGPPAVDLLLENYIGAAVATYRVYLRELVEGKAKN